MLVIGKPGSGKSSFVQKLLNESVFYKDQFNYVFVVSPSAAKLHIAQKGAQMTTTFSVEWIH